MCYLLEKCLKYKGTEMLKSKDKNYICKSQLKHSHSGYTDSKQRKFQDKTIIRYTDKVNSDKMFV